MNGCRDEGGRRLYRGGRGRRERWWYKVVMEGEEDVGGELAEDQTCRSVVLTGKDSRVKT